MKPTLELDNLSVGYGRRVLLKDLCASILPGQILTLIGPNGAGKSTILKTISHHLACMGGVVRIGGENIERMDSCELAKRLSVVLTERVRPELMTCYDVAASGRYPYTGRFGMLTALDRDVIAQSLALVRVKELADKPFARVSDGQRQRVMIARALCQQPRVLVLDEPVAGLDVVAREQFYDVLLADYAETGRTFIISTHIIEEAAGVFEDIIFIDNGRVIETGNCESFVAQFHYVSGRDEDVARACAGLQVIHEEGLGRSRTACVRGSLDTLRRSADGLDVDISGVTLQKVFVYLTGGHKEGE